MTISNNLWKQKNLLLRQETASGTQEVDSWNVCWSVISYISIHCIIYIFFLKWETNEAGRENGKKRKNRSLGMQLKNSYINLKKNKNGKNIVRVNHSGDEEILKELWYMFATELTKQVNKQQIKKKIKKLDKLHASIFKHQKCLETCELALHWEQLPYHFSGDSKIPGNIH